MKYYTLDKILETNSDYNIIIGERSNGKTYRLMKYVLEKYIYDDEQSAIIRRWDTDFKGQRANAFFKNVVSNGEVKKLTNGEWTNVQYFNGAWWLAKWDNDIKKYVRNDEPFAYKFALTDTEHDKSTSYPNVTTIVFDEFITRRYYAPDEFSLFLNTVSTIVRQRDNVKIFMLGNTVDKYCLYFKEMGLKHITNMEQGSIDVYKFANGKLKIAVEYCKTSKDSKQSNKYFCFDNNTAEMIINGTWELDIYPHLPVGFRYSRTDVVFNYFIRYDGEIVQADVIQQDDINITYIHAKTTPIKNEDKDVIYQLKPSPHPNIFNNLLSVNSKLERAIAVYFINNKVFYQDNSIGEFINNFLKTSCKRMNNTTLN